MDAEDVARALPSAFDRRRLNRPQLAAEGRAGTPLDRLPAIHRVDLGCVTLPGPHRQAKNALH
jgi:hypothetical protein